MITAIIFIIVISVLIFVHEFGHFIFAKRAGMKVEEFGFGYPPRLWGIKKGETIYSINWIPFGGFVKILGEDGEERHNPKSFSSKPFGSRLAVISAGVLMNFFLAVVLLMVCNFFGLRIGLIGDKTDPHTIDRQVQIIQIAQNSPAQKAGLQLLDEIEGFRISNGATVAVSSTEEVQSFVSKNAGHEINILIKRGGQTLEKNVVPRLNPPTDEGSLGVSLALTGVVKYKWYEAIWRGIYDAAILLINTVVGYFSLFKVLFTKGRLLAEVSGPVGIATLTGQAAKIGFSFLIQFVAMISVNLAVLNFLPFPALDGGRFLFLIVEKIKGSPINKKIEGLVNTVGFSLLIALMIYVTIKDVIKIF